MEFLLIIVSLFCSYALIRATFSLFGIGKPQNLPPGPKPLPIIGNLHLLGDQPHRSLANLAKTHGPIMFLKFGQIKTIVISSAAAAKEVLQKQDLAFSTRPFPDALNANEYAKFGVSFHPIGAQWRTLRRIIVTNIVSGKSLDAGQHLRTAKVKELIAYCEKASLANESVDIGRAAFRTTLNLLSNTIFSKDLTDPYEDSAKEFKELVGHIMVEVGKANLVDSFPVLRKIDPQGIRKRLVPHFRKVYEIFEELIKERLGSGSLNEDDALGVWLKMSQDSPNEINRSHIKGVLLDLFVAGTDTTANTLEWAMTEVVRNPDTMAKAKQELEQVIGKGKILKEEDVSKLPYLSCIVKESLRLHTPIPFLLPRKVEKEVTLNGYTILKDTQVIVNAWAICRDSTVWEDSQDFKPERFLTSKLDVRGQDFELIPFGAGRRICPGLPLAIHTLHVMLGSLLNMFDWRIESDIRASDLDVTECFGLTLQKAKPLCVVPIPLS